MYFHSIKQRINFGSKIEISDRECGLYCSRSLSYPKEVLKSDRQKEKENGIKDRIVGEYNGIKRKRDKNAR